MKRFIQTLGIFLMASVLLALPISAAESVSIPVEFNTASNEEFTAAVLSSDNCVSAAGDVNACQYGFSFNSSAADNGNTLWANATAMDDGTTMQSNETANNAIVIITNTGTATLNINMNVTEITDSCLNMTYTFNDTIDSEGRTSEVPGDAYLGNGVQGQIGNGLAAIDLNTSWTSGESSIHLYFWGNFSSCLAGTDRVYLHINSTVV
jgi:hypothetical protein